MITDDLCKELVATRASWKTSKEKYTNPTVDTQLIGYSAFYRWDTAHNKYITKNFSLTSLGDTGYQ